MLVYFTAVNHVSFGRLNNLASPMAQWRSTCVGVIPGLLVIAGLRSGGQSAAALGAVWLWIWLALQVRQWWIPYLFGASVLHRDFTWYVAGGFDKTLRLLPPVAGWPCPDLQHLLLQALTLAAAISTTLVARS